MVNKLISLKNSYIRAVAVLCYYIRNIPSNFKVCKDSIAAIDRGIPDLFEEYGIF